MLDHLSHVLYTMPLFASTGLREKEAAPVAVEDVIDIMYASLVEGRLSQQTVAVVGAVGGAAVKLAFIEHFQGVARGHFTVRQLERVYGAEIVRAEYDRLKTAFAAAA